MDREEICITELHAGGRVFKAAVANNLGQSRQLIETYLNGNAPAQVLWLRA